MMFTKDGYNFLVNHWGALYVWVDWRIPDFKGGWRHVQGWHYLEVHNGKLSRSFQSI